MINKNSRFRQHSTSLGGRPLSSRVLKKRWSDDPKPESECRVSGSDPQTSESANRISGFFAVHIPTPESDCRDVGICPFPISRHPSRTVGMPELAHFRYPDARHGMSGRRNLLISDIPTSESDCRDLGIFHFRHPEIRDGMSGCRLTENPTSRYPSRNVGMSAYGKPEIRNPIVGIGISKNVGPTG